MRTITTQEKAAVSGGSIGYSAHSGNGSLTLGALNISWQSNSNGYSVFKWSNLTESGKIYQNNSTGQIGGYHNSIFSKIAH